MIAKVKIVEHWCVDGCGEIIEQKGSICRVRRYLLVLESARRRGPFASESEMRQFAAENNIEIVS